MEQSRANLTGKTPSIFDTSQYHDWKTGSDAKRIGGCLYDVTLADGSTRSFHAN